MVNNFANLSTEKFRLKLRPAALLIYRKLFPGCEIEDLRGEGFKVHILDKEFGIDSLIKLPSQQWLTIQEKYRKNEFLKYGDFTQEYKNAEGTPFECNGEWFKLGAQLYFYGWANKDETDFEKWILLDVARYKILIEKLGGLKIIGKKRMNFLHGKASFYSIPLKTLKPSILKTNFLI